MNYYTNKLFYNVLFGMFIVTSIYEELIVHWSSPNVTKRVQRDQKNIKKRFLNIVWKSIQRSDVGKTLFQRLGIFWIVGILKEPKYKSEENMQKLMKSAKMRNK